MPKNDKEPRLNRWWRAGGVVTVIVIVIVAWCGWLAQLCMAGRKSALRFVAAVREGRQPAAEGLVSPELAEALRSDTNTARTLSLLRSANANTGLGIAQTGFTGNWPMVPFSCFDGELTDKSTFWIVVQKRDKGWQIVDVRSDAEPRICHGEGE